MDGYLKVAHEFGWIGGHMEKTVISAQRWMDGRMKSRRHSHSREREKILEGVVGVEERIRRHIHILAIWILW